MKGSFLVSDILRDACWVSEVTLKGSRIVSEPAPCGPVGQIPLLVHLAPQNLPKARTPTSDRFRPRRRPDFLLGDVATNLRPAERSNGIWP